MDALRRTILYPFKASVPETYWKVCKLINALFLDLEIEVPVMSVSTGSSSVDYGNAHAYITVGLNKEVFGEFSETTTYSDISLPIDISNVMVKYSRLHPLLSATDMPYDPSTPVDGYTVVVPGTTGFGASSGINSTVSYKNGSASSFYSLGTLTYRAHPGYGLGKYTSDPWSKEPAALDGSVFSGIKSINGLNLSHNVNIKESSEVLRVLDTSATEDSSTVEESVSDSISYANPGNPVQYSQGIIKGLSFCLTSITVNPYVHTVTCTFSVESAPIHFRGVTQELLIGSLEQFTRIYVEFVSISPSESSSTQSSSSSSPESSSSVVESSSSTIESSSSVEESSSSDIYEYIWFEDLGHKPEEDSSSVSSSSTSIVESSSSITESSSSIQDSSSAQSSSAESSSSIVESSSSIVESSSSVSTESSSSITESSSSSTVHTVSNDWDILAIIFDK